MTEYVNAPEVLTPALAESYWARAKASELGLRIRTTDIRATQALLYDVRRLSSDPSLQDFMLCLPNGGQEVFIVRKTVEVIRI